jgi:hypothetical protein
MALTLKPGQRLYGANDSAEFIVVKAPPDAVNLSMGGVPPMLSREEPSGSETTPSGASVALGMGKRLVDAEGTVELLVTRSGNATPAIDGRPLHLKESKPLPASD